MAGLEGRDDAVETVVDDPSGDVGDAIDGESEVREDDRRGRRRPEMVEADDRAVGAGPAVPTERCSGLDADALPNVRRQDRVPVRLFLRLELLPARQTDDAGCDAIRFELL